MTLTEINGTVGIAENMDVIEKPELIKPSEAARELTVSAPTLRKLAQQGVLNPVKYSTKCIRYRRDEVNRVRAEGAPIVGMK